MVTPLNTLRHPGRAFDELREQVDRLSDRELRTATLIRAGFTLLFMPIFFTIGYTGYFHLVHIISQSLGWGFVIFIFWALYQLVLRRAEIKSPGEEPELGNPGRKIWERSLLFFHSFTAQEIYWFSLAFSFFVFTAFDGFGDGATLPFSLFWLALFPFFLVWNYALTWQSIRSRLRDRRQSWRAFGLYFTLTWVATAIHGYIFEYHFALGFAGD